jgi:mRNA interferase MazF
MRKGRLVLIPFPFTDLSGQKVRPALILHVSRGEDCIVAFISSHVTKKKNQFDVFVQPSTENGLKAPSVVKVDKIATLQRKIVVGELGTIERSALRAVDRALEKIFRL